MKPVISAGLILGFLLIPLSLAAETAYGPPVSDAYVYTETSGANVFFTLAADDTGDAAMFDFGFKGMVGAGTLFKIGLSFVNIDFLTEDDVADLREHGYFYSGFISGMEYEIVRSSFFNVFAGCGLYLGVTPSQSTDEDQSQWDDEEDEESADLFVILILALLDAIFPNGDSDFDPDYLGAFYGEAGIHIGLFDPDNVETVALTVSYRHMMTSWGRDYDFGMTSVGLLVSFY